ncbi:hypothetical protein [Aquisediminimonas profunda]|uniref:hypothetical protein n=1 Tax=Aquisediminimonas profunda TaxID=1550733 RepID=UPI001FE54C19|nr:hypothetical protein [Aquisediminimonas profunda]
MDGIGAGEFLETMPVARPETDLAQRLSDVNDNDMSLFQCSAPELIAVSMIDFDCFLANTID